MATSVVSAKVRSPFQSDSSTSNSTKMEPMERMTAIVPVLHVGDWLDVIDSDGIWNVAQVLKLPTPETVRITYDCWGDAYNEELRRDSDRIAPYHTHTWAVKCWAKLATWPWWPALVTIRTPGTSIGAQNLRLEEKLLVDFLDKTEFSKRFRCWVKKSSIVAYQSDKVTRIRQTKSKMKGYQGEARSKNLAFAIQLLAKCDGQEHFPTFVQGTLPVQFEHNFIKPIEEVRNEIGHENWIRAFVDNRSKHAATHGYTPVITGSSESDNWDSMEPPQLVDKAIDASAEGASDMAEQQEKHSSSLLDAEIVSTMSTHKKAMDASPTLVKDKVATQEPTNARKQARPNAEDHISDSAEPSRAEDATSSRTQTPKECAKQCQGPNFSDGKYREDESDETISKPSTVVTKEVRIEPRRYGKTPKKLKTARKSASKLPPYSPPYARLLPRSQPRDEEHTAFPSYGRHAAQSRSRVENGLQPGVPDKLLPASDRHLQQPNAAVRRVLACESKLSDESVSPMRNRASLANAILRTDEKLRNTKTGLSDKLAEPTEKTAETEATWNKCAALPVQVNSRTPDSPQNSRGDCQVHSLTPDIASETQDVIQEALPLRRSSYDSFKASKVPTFTRRSLQPTYAIRKLEIALDNVISKQQGHNLNAATTPAELDAIKAELLRSPEVQAAISRVKHPSYEWVAPTAFIAEISYRERSSLSKGHSARKPSQRSSSQQLWRYDRKSEASLEGSRDLSTCSVLPGSSSADHSTFGFSVNDNFSMNQWYRDLYPKSFGFQ